MSRYLLIFLNFCISLFLVFYFMGNNPFEYLWIIYAKTLALVTLFFGLILFLNLIISLYEKRHNKSYIFFDFFILIYFLILDVLILGCTLFEGKLIPNFITSYIIQMIVFCIWQYKILKPAISILLCLIVFNASIYFSKIYKAQDLGPSFSYGTMLHKPNIYLIFLESYQGNEALRKLYHYDNTPFLDDLKNLDFKVYEKVYSNAPNTRASLSSIFAISDLNSIPENFIDYLLTSPYKYKVSNTFLLNDYDIEYIFPTAYLTQQDYRCPSSLATASLFSQKYLKEEYSLCAFHYESFEDFINSVTKHATRYRKKPFLFITKIGGISENNISYSGGITHIPNEYRHTGKIDLLSDLRKNYIAELKKENVLLTNVIKEIIKKDPSGLIILIGDHGGNFLEIYDRIYSNNIMPFLYENKIDKDDFMLDFYNILLAIKWPDYMRGDENIQMSPELFKIILEKLIPDLKIPVPSHQFFDINLCPITDISLEREA